MKGKIPQNVLDTCKSLKSSGFEAYIVGGCVRDIIIGREPKDWDLTTNAAPDQIISIFKDTFYENSFGTVGVKTDSGIIEVTPYRKEGEYSDSRHPDKVEFTTKIEEDLLRRDFTINAIAFDPETETYIDPYEGIKDIEKKVIRAVGDSNKRFEEDGLRLMRAVRFASELGFMINIDTQNALVSHATILDKIAKERVRDELIKIIMSPNPAIGLNMCQMFGLMPYIIPELDSALHVKQNQAHSYDVFEHLIRSLQAAADKNMTLELRLSALLHDIGKPNTKRTDGGEITFYGHEVVGAKMAKKILENLKFPSKVIEHVTKLVRWHMFFSDPDQISPSAVRRMIANVGKEHIWELMDLRICDRVGTGRPKEDPYRLRKYKAMIDEVMRDPVSVAMLKINGDVLINKLNIKPGPILGYILNILLEDVLNDPQHNTEEYLLSRAGDLALKDIMELSSESARAISIIESVDEGQIKEIRAKYAVK